MSLLSQTARYLLFTAFIIALVGAVGFYTLIHRKIRHEVDEILVSQVEQSKHRLQKRPATAIIDWDDNPHIERVTIAKRPEFTDITLPDSLNNNNPVPIRQLSTTALINGQLYLITVRIPYYEFNELSREISLGVIIGFLVLMAMSVGVGLGMARRLWLPFYATIDQLSSFQLDQPAAPAFPQSRIHEFSLLSQSLGQLTQKLRHQFSLQKQFAENASHELQTPLAIASAELELLMQSEQLTETDHAHLQRATDALSRLRQMNRSLLLLTQVENNQFIRADSLDLSALVHQYADEYKPFFEHKQMHFSESIAPNIHLRMNRQLTGVLLTNLLKNAVRHGLSGGYIHLELNSNALIIRNAGRPLPFTESQLFDRFVKDPARSDSTGLGLALVKQICDRHGLPLTYTYDSALKRHSFQIGLR